MHNLDGFSEFPSSESESAPCFQPLGDTVFFTFEAGPDTDDVRGIGGIVTNDSPVLLDAIQAGWLRDDDPMSTLKEPFSGNIFGHMYNGFSRGLTWATPLVNGDQSTILFVTYPTPAPSSGRTPRAAASPPRCSPRPLRGWGASRPASSPSPSPTRCRRSSLQSPRSWLCVAASPRRGDQLLPPADAEGIT